MERALPRPLDIDWRWLWPRLLPLLLLWSLVASVTFAFQTRATDWRNLALAGQLAGTPELYETLIVGPFRWSPIAAWLLVPLAALGSAGWTALHVLAAFAFGSWRITAVVLVSFPFWMDALSGNVLTFVALAAWWALRGSRVATFVYLAMCLLMPRPLMLPVAAWIVWQRPEWRLPFAGMFALHAAAVAVSGLGPQWLGVLSASGELAHEWNWAPSRFIGPAWIPIGFALAAWLTWRGRLGLASVAASPYIFPYYALMLVLEISRPSTYQTLPSRLTRH